MEFHKFCWQWVILLKVIVKVQGFRPLNYHCTYAMDVMIQVKRDEFPFFKRNPVACFAELATEGTHHTLRFNGTFAIGVCSSSLTGYQQYSAKETGKHPPPHQRNLCRWRHTGA